MLLGWSSGCINSAISHQDWSHYTDFDVFFDISLNIRMFLCVGSSPILAHYDILFLGYQAFVKVYMFLSIA